MNNINSNSGGNLSIQGSTKNINISNINNSFNSNNNMGHSENNNLYKDKTSNFFNSQNNKTSTFKQSFYVTEINK